MDAIEDIFAEYRRMREHGLSANEALRALRSYVEPLSHSRREDLARQLRAWEQGGEETVEAREETLAVPPEEIAELRNRTTTEIWVECEHCGRKNRKGEIFCFACGQLLNTQESSSTRHFASATQELFSAEYFGGDSVLLLTVPDHPQGQFELRPQLRQNEMVMGRSTKNVSVRPEIDLATVGGAELGVSRLHAVLSYEATGEMIHIYDLGSANGTYINGRRLHPTERRVLRDGDELRLGRLMLRAQFRHPGEEISE